MNSKLGAVAALSLVFLFGGCEWFTTFKRQPSIHPWESYTMDTTKRDSVPPRGQPRGSVPLGGASLPDFVVSYNPLPSAIDSMSSLVNPTRPSAASLANGRKYFQINCTPCHGNIGAGDGTVTKYSGAFRISLLTDQAKGRSDGYIYGMIRNGRGSMPPYNRIEAMDRWDVVNYVRGLQGKLDLPVPTGPLGVPGETGDKLPGFTATAPTRPVPYRHPDSVTADGAAR